MTRFFYQELQMERERSRLYDLALIAIVVLLVRFAFSLVYTPDNNFNQDNWLSIARNVVNGQGYSLSDGRGATARRGPTVVYFFAVVLWLFGDSVWPIIIAQWLADVGTAILLYFIALEVFKDRRVAIISSWLFAFYGPGISLTLIALSEPVYTLILAGFTLSLLRALRQPLIWRFAVSGVLLGLATLARPVMQFYPIVVLPMMFWFLSRQWRLVLPRFAVLSITFAAVLLPWTVRNYLVFNAFIPASSNSGGLLYYSHGILGEPDYLRYRSSQEINQALVKLLESHFGPAPNGSGKRVDYVISKGLSEDEVNRVAQQEAIKAIRAYPGRAALQVLWNFIGLWSGFDYGRIPSLKSSLTGVTNITLLGLAAAALIFFRGDGWLRLAVPLIVLVGFNTAIHMVAVGGPRYNMPVMPYCMILAAQTIVHLLPNISWLVRLYSYASTKVPHMRHSAVKGIDGPMR
jgi:4-amino-4-deoxy-L-arabinose transferase-like glycosyltransferase